MADYPYIDNDDKRLIPEFVGASWCRRTSEPEWHSCKYCYKQTPTFKFEGGRLGSNDPTLVLRCCWECGSGIETLRQESSVLG